MPRKEFEAFTRLDASDVNTYLMDQSVMTFGSATARDAAIDTPAEGQVTYLTDIDSLTVYNGTQWVTNRPVMSFAGTAARGSAIGTATEGMVTYLEDSNLLSIYDGTNWKSSLGVTGGILQVVHAKTSTVAANTTTTFADTGLTATITPKSISSKILVIVSQNGVTRSNSSASHGVNLRVLYPNASTDVFASNLGFTGTTTTLYTNGSFAGIYTPASLSAQTFKTQFASTVATVRAGVQDDSNQASSMILMEIAD